MKPCESPAISHALRIGKDAAPGGDCDIDDIVVGE
jgi:hypothetical protein